MAGVGKGDRVGGLVEEMVEVVVVLRLSGSMPLKGFGKEILLPLLRCGCCVWSGSPAGGDEN